MARVLICGGGVGGLAAAHRLRRLLAEDDEVVVLDRSPVHTFWPSLLWVMTGARTPQQVTRPFAALRDSRITVVQDEVTAIEPEARAVVAGGKRWQGDALVLALGAELDGSSIPGLQEEGGNFYTLAGAEAVWQRLQALDRGRVVVCVTRAPFKCPAAPYEAAMLIDGFLRKRRRRDRVEVEVWAAEPAPMGVAGPAVSEAVVHALRERDIAYHPGQTLVEVDARGKRLMFADGSEVPYDLLAYVPPHRVPRPVAASGLAPADGWVAVDRHTLRTAAERVYALGDLTQIPLAMGKPLPKAGVFAHRQGEVVAELLGRQLRARGQEARFDGVGECFIEMGGGIAGFARGNFYQEPLPSVRVYRPGRHWHAGKVAFERHWWAQWW